jgi:hypothetical protein
MEKRFLMLLAGILFSCSPSNSDEGIDGNLPPGSNPSAEWSIPVNEVLDGGPGKDGIPALVNPEFKNQNEITYLNDSDLVIGFKQGNDVRAYPHVILDWHEIVNDNLGDKSVAITYCPLTGTGIGWNRIINGSETTFGVSGLLYNTNLIPYDRATDSNWSQILNKSVNGELKDQEAELFSLVETNWGNWKSLYPNSRVMSLNTGFSRTYGVSPYGDYNTNNDRFLFPVPKDNRLPLKERVHAITNGEDSRVYRFGDFTAGNHIIRDNFKGEEYLIVGNQNFIVSYKLNAETTVLDFEYISGEADVILVDNQNNKWNIFGEAIAGPRLGSKLENSASFMGFWFSIPAFYNTEIYNN